MRISTTTSLSNVSAAKDAAACLASLNRLIEAGFKYLDFNLPYELSMAPKRKEHFFLSDDWLVKQIEEEDYPEVLMDIDFKVYSLTMETAKKVLPMVEAMRMMDRAVYNCIDCDVLAYVCENYGKRTVGAPHFYPHIKNYLPGKEGSFKQMWGICIPIRDLCEDWVRYYRDLGIAIVCTPADTPSQVELAARFNVTLPLCDDPRDYLRVAAEKGL